jgi:DNA-binding SARP family transcriptional activator
VLQCWRGEPLGDLDRLDELVPEVQHVRERLIDATLALGEARLAAGDAPGTETCAERVLSVDPYAERALRLLIAAQVHRGDRRLIDGAVTRALSALQEPPSNRSPRHPSCCARRGTSSTRSLSGARAGRTREFGDDGPLPA